MNKQIGHIISNGVVLEKHELATVVFLSSIGENIILIPPSKTPGSKSPDIKMRGVFWEMKSPQFSRYSTLEHIYKKALKQAPNLIFDLRRIKQPTTAAQKSLQRLFNQSKQAKNMIIIYQHCQTTHFLDISK